MGIEDFISYSHNHNLSEGNSEDLCAEQISTYADIGRQYLQTGCTWTELVLTYLQIDDFKRDEDKNDDRNYDGR